MSDLDYCDFIYHIPELLAKNKANDMSDEIEDEQATHKSDKFIVNYDFSTHSNWIIYNLYKFGLCT